MYRPEYLLITCKFAGLITIMRKADLFITNMLDLNVV